MSTRVLLATLSIPITPERTDIARLLDMDGIIVEKHRRLATLLGLQSPPTRQSLINDMVRCSPPYSHHDGSYWAVDRASDGDHSIRSMCVS